MNKVNELMLFESVILHCQILHDITGTKEALVAAQKDGLIDFYNQLTSAGRNVGYMMLADVEEYEKLFDVEAKKTPDVLDQQAPHQLQLEYRTPTLLPIAPRLSDCASR